MHEDLIRELRFHQNWRGDKPLLTQRAADALEAMQADAARYHYLRDGGFSAAQVISVYGTEVVAYRRGEKLDAAIDAARSGETT